MSENAQCYRYRREQGDDYDKRRPRRSRPGRRREKRGRNQRGDYNYRRDYSRFPKFKDNRSEERQNLEIMKNSYESKASGEQNSSGIGGYSEWDTQNLKGKTAPTRRKRKDEQLKSEKGENADTQQYENWDKREEQNEIKLNVYPNTRKRFRSSSTDSDVEKLKTQVQILLNKANNQNETTAAPALKDDNQKNASSSSSNSGDSSSEEENPVNAKQLKQENVSEDEVVCLGALEQVENLIERSSDKESNESCILCEKEGHTSFYCFMVCKNCGGKYHSLTNCPKPANISTVLQRLMEFNLSQCRQYNPEEKFDFNSQLFIDSEGIQNAFKRYFESNSRVRPSPAHSKSSRKRRSPSTDSQCSSSGNTSKKRKQRKPKTDVNNSFNPFSFNCGFPPSFPFGTTGMPFGAQGLNMNSIFALAQMMGQLPFNSTNNRI